MSKQIWRHTWYEVATNLVVGYFLACFGNWGFLWVLGYKTTVLEMGSLGLFMTVLSILRQLVVRRVFEHIRIVHLRSQQDASSSK